MIVHVDSFKYVRKAAVAGATALATLYVVLDGGITPREWCLVALSALGSVGVFAVRNEPLP